MNITVRESNINGEVRASPSKSYTHRSVICAMLAHGRSRIHNPLKCEDTMTTMNMCRSLGAEIHSGDPLTVEGTGDLKPPEGIMDCKGSGTSLRFFTALSALVPGITILTGDDSLRRRPMGDLLKALRQLGIKGISRKNGLPPIIIFGGKIEGGNVAIRGDVSSQFISALLISSPKAVKKTVIRVTKLQSRPYVEITLDVLKEFGIECYFNNNQFFIPPNQQFKSKNYTIEGDFSSAAFLLAAGALAGKVTVSGLRSDSIQGDKKIVEMLYDMGADIMKKNNTITVEKGELRSTAMDIFDTPDLAPVCAVLATQAKGISTITNAERLKFKESNRLFSITNVLKKLGADIHRKNNQLMVKGPTCLKGSIIDPHNDHRIAMGCAIAGLVASGKTIIKNVECINKSYPHFLGDLKTLGADIT